MIPVEKLVRLYITGIVNAYCLVFFACCREIKQISQYELEKQARKLLKEMNLDVAITSKTRGNVEESRLVGNFIFSFGCQPGQGVNASSKYIADMLDLFLANFDHKTGVVILPDVFSKVLSSDATFETVTSNLARKLSLERQDNLVGAKRMIYAINKSDKDKEAVRKITTDFFIDTLGFKKEDILFVGRKQFIGDFAKGTYKTKFLEDT